MFIDILPSFGRRLCLCVTPATVAVTIFASVLCVLASRHKSWTRKPADGRGIIRGVVDLGAVKPSGPLKNVWGGGREI